MTERLVTDINGRKYLTTEPLLHPPSTQRTWVGLTAEEIVMMSRYDLQYAALIGEVERKLKEKNT
jgi:hypothetical protein